MINFSDLARSTGFSGSLKDVIDSQRRGLIADFIACYRLLEEESPALLKRTGFSEYYHQLSQLSGPTTTWLFHLPTTSFWIDVLRQLVIRRTHKTMPSGHPSAHLKDFGRFVLAAYVYEGLSGEIKIRLDRDSRLYLPGLRGVWLCPKELRLTELVAIVDNETLLLSAPDGGGASLKRSQIMDFGRKHKSTVLHRCGNGFRYRYLPISCKLFEVSNGDPYLRLIGRVSYDFEALTKVAEGRWVRSIEQAWGMILRGDPLVADEIANVVDVMVPVVSESLDVHLSCSFPELIGGFYLSWSPEAQTLAEAIVHEYHHVKLNAVLDIDPLITGGTEEAIFYSPWRNDPRPLSGLLHAVFAFAGVTRFWLAYLKSMENTSEPFDFESVSSKIAKSVLQLEYAIDSLRQHTAFTDAGRQIVDALLDELEQMKAKQPRLPQAQDALVKESVRSHLEQWQKNYKLVANSSTSDHDEVVERSPKGLANSDWVLGCVLLNPTDEPSRLPLTNADSRIMEATSVILGQQAEIPINRIHEGIHQKDQFLDDLFTLRQENRADYDTLRELTDASRGIKSTLGTYMWSLFSYIEGEYLESAEALLDVISAYPDNVDAWRYFAFALRHCGHYAASRTILFNLAASITYTQQNLSKRNLKIFEGEQCDDCGWHTLNAFPQMHLPCIGCGGTSFNDIQVTAPVSYHCGLTYMVTALEQLGELHRSNDHSES